MFSRGVLEENQGNTPKNNEQLRKTPDYSSTRVYTIWFVLKEEGQQEKFLDSTVYDLVCLQVRQKSKQTQGMRTVSPMSSSFFFC